MYIILINFKMNNFSAVNMNKFYFNNKYYYFYK